MLRNIYTGMKDRKHTSARHARQCCAKTPHAYKINWKNAEKKLACENLFSHGFHVLVHIHIKGKTQATW
jgi:hypothetical protein